MDKKKKEGLAFIANMLIPALIGGAIGSVLLMYAEISLEKKGE